MIEDEKGFMHMDNSQKVSGYTRRDFGKIILAGVPVSVALNKIDSQINGVRIGVQSYSFRRMSLDEAIEGMVEIGIGECELFSGHVEPHRGSARDPFVRERLRQWRLTTPLDHFRTIRRKFDDVGIRLHAYNLSFNDSFTDGEIDRGFQMAQALGVEFITASATVSSAKRVAPFAEKYKMVVAMHNHDRVEDPNQFARPESFAKAMSYSDYIGINLDIGHFFAAGYDPLAYIRAHHARITNLHLKDRNRNRPGERGANVPWGQGGTPVTEVLQLLRSERFSFPANIEYEYSIEGAETVTEVTECFEYCKKALV